MAKDRILIIDDDPNLRKSLADILRRKGYEIFSSANGTEGMALMRENAVNLVLVDIGLPDISGIDVLKKIKTEFPATEVIILTGNATLDSAIESANEDAFSYLLKPYDIEQLTLHIRRAIEKQQTEDAIRKLNAELEQRVRERTQELEIQRREAEEARFEAEIANRTKSDFLANVSHELRTPLNSVIGFSEILQNGMSGSLNPKQQEYADNIVYSGKRLLDLINNILDFVSAETGNMELEISRFSLQQLLKGVISMFTEKALMKGVTLYLETARESDVEIEADMQKTKQIMFNLLSNAIKFTPEGGTVRVSAQMAASPCGCPESGGPKDLLLQCDGSIVEVSVEDTGIGICAEDMEKLFTDFKQLESPYVKRHQGVGLGLALTKRLVELQGGCIRAKSEFGKGSRFTIAVPLLQNKGTRCDEQFKTENSLR